MNPGIAKAVMLAASIVLVAIRAPYGQRSRKIKVVKSRKGPLEVVLLILAGIGFFLPLVWMATSFPAFASYPLRPLPFGLGIVCFVAGLWFLYRSHVDLGPNWSVTLEVRENHRLVTRGVYRLIRHPMYLGFLLYGVGQALVVPNYVVGASYFATFGLLFALRVGREEQMMIDEFGPDYVAYMARTKRLFPGIW